MKSLKDARDADNVMDEQYYAFRRQRVNKKNGERIACEQATCSTIIGREEKAYSDKFVRGCFLPLDIFAEDVSLNEKFESKEELIGHIENQLNKNVVIDSDGVVGVEVFHKLILTEKEMAGGAYFSNRGISKSVNRRKEEKMATEDDIRNSKERFGVEKEKHQNKYR